MLANLWSPIVGSCLAIQSLLGIPLGVPLLPYRTRFSPVCTPRQDCQLFLSTWVVGTSFIPLLHLVFQLLSNYGSHPISFQHIYFWIEVVRVNFCCLQPKNPKWYRPFLPLIFCPLWFQASGYHEFGREAVLQKDSPLGKCSWRWRPEWAVLCLLHASHPKSMQAWAAAGCCLLQWPFWRKLGSRAAIKVL